MLKKKRAAPGRFGSFLFFDLLLTPCFSLDSLFLSSPGKMKSALFQTECSILQVLCFCRFGFSLQGNGKRNFPLPSFYLAAALAAKPRPTPPLLTPLLSTSCSGLITLGPSPPGTCVTLEAREAAVSLTPGSGAGVLLWANTSGRGTTEPLAFFPTVTLTFEPSSRKRQDTRTGARVTGSTRRTLE